MDIRRENLKNNVRYLLDQLRRDQPHLLNSISLVPSPPGEHSATKNIIVLVDWLKQENNFSFARRLLGYARKHLTFQSHEQAEKRKLRQQHSLCCYKDSDMATELGLQHALEILSSDEEDETLEETITEETLGIAGAIYKRMWEVDTRKQHLERAFHYYNRGYEQFKNKNEDSNDVDKEEKHVEDDDGYTGINAAFILDLMSVQESNDTNGQDSNEAKRLLTQAKSIRQYLISKLEPRAEQENSQDPWLLATLAEAHFGLKQYTESEKWLLKLKVLQKNDSWQSETLVRQLASLVYLHDDKAKPSDPKFNEHPGVNALDKFLDNKSILASFFIGKVGLALSGGGYRASLFHLGVLAKLAEYDVLKYIEVLSCVSGGSIVGAHYYLGLKELLEDNPNPDRFAYLRLVEKVLNTFVAGVKKGLRNKAMRQFWRRSDRAAELFEEYFYSVIDPAKGGSGHNMADLKIIPQGENSSFTPMAQNWQRQDKVPTLILNATTLNTGHNWQFTSTWMGEPPANIESDIDANYRLRRMYYDEAPTGYKNKGVTLGSAVAASACVPGLFNPLELKNLYSDKNVALVDGGVRENQGVFGLFEQNCDVLLVSDGSGQMDAEDEPSTFLTSVPIRSSDITMKTVRIAYYKQILARCKPSRLRSVMYLHLKKDLEMGEVDWIQNHLNPTQKVDLDIGGTGYGIPKKIQRRLAGIRTDLDVFSDEEMYGLMLSGYKMAEKELPKAVANMPLSKDAPHKWPFLNSSISTQDTEEKLDALAFSHSRFGRGVKRKWQKLKDKF